LGSDDEVIVSASGWTGVTGGLEIELQPARKTAATTMRIEVKFRMPDLSRWPDPTSLEWSC
jgi:hypothetical protein